MTLPGKLSGALAEVAAAVAERENDIARIAKLEAGEAEWREQVRRLNAMLDKWMPELCARPGCSARAPNRAHAELLRARGYEIAVADALAWSLGFCSPAHAEEARSEESNVLPFPVTP